MAAFFADENFPLQVVEAIRRFGHDVLTTSEAGQSGKAVSDREILDLAVSLGRAVLTLNRRHFIRLHEESPTHSGIVVCSADADTDAQARRIHEAVREAGVLAGRLLRVNRPAN